MQVKLIRTDGKIQKVNIKTFKEAKHYVSMSFYESSIEIVHLVNAKIMLLDEEGKIKNLSYNEIATQLARENNSIYPSDFIAGDVIIVDDVDEFDSLSYQE